MGWSVAKGLKDKTVACKSCIIGCQDVKVFKAVRIMMAVEYDFKDANKVRANAMKVQDFGCSKCVWRYM